MTGFDLGVDFRTVVFARMLQTLGLAFLFVSHQYRRLCVSAQGENNAASGLMNLARNIGGSVGISIVTTMLDRRSQFHMNRMSGHWLGPVRRCRPCFRAHLKPFKRGVFSPSEAMHRAYALFASQLWPPSFHAGLY